MKIEARGTRRDQLAAFLRSRRERITPEDVGLPPGLRRRTPGLRREEVAQLAGVGVTWYTWLEQGRRINASVQVLDAIARTLRLDSAEREHLYRLADLPGAVEPDATDALEPEIHEILRSLDPLAACVYNARFDLLAWNSGYAALFPQLVRRPRPHRNALVELFTTRACCATMVNEEEELSQMVATVRGAFARHVGEPVWDRFIGRMSETSPVFARMWAMHDVARPGSRLKGFIFPDVGLLRLATTSLALTAPAECRIIVYTPADVETREKVALMRAAPRVPCLEHALPATTSGGDGAAAS